MGVRITRTRVRRDPTLRDIADAYLADLEARAGGEHFRTTKRQLLRIVAAPAVQHMLGHKDPAFTAKHYMPPAFLGLHDEMGKVWGRE